VLAYYVDELRKRGHGRAHCWLPHDGINTNAITGHRYADHLRDAGFEVDVVPNQGTGAAARIEAVRRILPRCWFDKDKTEGGRDERPLAFEEVRRTVVDIGHQDSEGVQAPAATEPV
jgi:phage terminase large subunit